MRILVIFVPLLFTLCVSPVPLMAMGDRPGPTARADSVEPPSAAGSDRPKTFQVEVRVDFGPSGKAPHREKLEVEKGTTPKEAVSQIFPVLSGKACCSLKELIAIDGVAIDPAKNRWWTCSIDGSKKNVSPQKTKLKRGDVVEWKYTEDKQ